MSKPELSVVHPEPLSTNVVERLEFLLDKAKKGELSAFACALVYRDGMSGECWSYIPHYSIMIGALERMKYNILKAVDD